MKTPARHALDVILAESQQPTRFLDRALLALAAVFENLAGRCRFQVARCSRDRILALLEERPGTDPVGKLGRELDRLNAALDDTTDRINVSR